MAPFVPALLLLAACSKRPAADVAAPEPETPPAPASLPLDAPGGVKADLGKPVHLEGRDLAIEPNGARLHVNYLSGELVPVGDGDLVDLETPSSFEVRVDALEVVIPEQTIEAALAIPGDDAPFRELKVRTEGESLVLDGTGGPLGLPFSFKANPRVTDDGTLVLDLEKVGVLGIGVRGFIGAFKGHIERAANKHGHLIAIDKDQLRLDPFPLGGPPEVHAAFTSVEVREHGIVARLGELPKAEAGGAPGLSLTGGTLRSGGFVLFDPKLHLVAVDGGDLVINPEKMDAQIETGFIKQHQDGSLTIHVAAP
jgi:hypothetical protein